MTTTTAQFPEVDPTTFQLPDVVRSRIAQNLTDASTVEGAAVGGAIAAAPRGATRFAVLGDSTCRGVYTGDSEPGIDGATIYQAGDSWSTWAVSLSGGALVRARNAGIIGNTLAMMDARVVADICDYVPKVGACVVYSGYNDAYSNVAPAVYMASLKSIVGKLRTAGVLPILATPMPTVNSNAISALIVQYGLSVRKFAADQGLPLLDFQKWATDPSTGGLIAAVGTGGDGVHPGAAGQKWLGQKVSDALTPILTATSDPRQISPLDTSNALPNGMFTGTPTSGLAPNVFVVGSTEAGITYSVVTDPLVPGSMQRVTHAGSTAAQSIAMRIPTANFAAGDVIEYSGVITTAGVPARVQVEFYVNPSGTEPLMLSQDATRAFYCCRVVTPAGGPGYIDVEMGSGPGTGTADFGQLTARNLTQLGLV